MTTTDEQRDTVAKIIESARMGVFTTTAADGSLVSRPMAVQERRFDGSLYFFTAEPSPKTEEIAANPQVNVALQSDQDWVSVSGTASITRDPALIEKLWNRHAEAWFDGGRDDPAVALIKVDADTAEYWTVDSPKVVAAVKYAASLVTGKEPDLGKNETVEL